MKYTSTRNSKISLTAADAIVKGISEEGGLFVPQSIPNLKLNDIQKLVDMSYQERAFNVLKPFLNFSDENLLNCVNNAYNGNLRNFRTNGVTRLVDIGDSAYMLELWHGPTAAFKDMALQILPRLLNASKNNLGKNDKTLILVATSGDTGKAALEGFKDVEGIEIAVFYPEDGVSETQKLQMTTQEGENVHVFAVKGNFDDCQNGVKGVFSDSKIIDKAKKANIELSSANSINWGRLCPQIAYYFSAYADLVRQKTVKIGDKVNICVPTGNFGNILAAYYAMEMGLPVEKFICASNTNNVLTDFINTGVYNREREFHTTTSPSMDILISSNLERLLYHLSGNKDKQVKEWFDDLIQYSKFLVDKKIKTKLQSLFYGGWCSEEDTAMTIKTVFNKTGYLMDPHTAVAYKVLQDYTSELEVGKSKIKTIIVSTASPYKFGEAVYEALYGEYPLEEYRTANSKNRQSEEIAEFDKNSGNNISKDTLMKKLEERTGIRIPAPLAEIEKKPTRFTEILEKTAIKDAVLKFL